MAKKIKLGVAGLGRAFALMKATLAFDPRIELTAAADPRVDARKQFEKEFKARAYDTVEDLCKDSSVEAIYVATPHEFHAEHVMLATSNRKHVLVEKPMAIRLDDCKAMIDAARHAGVHIVVGHSHSFNAPVQRAREIVSGGSVGAVRMINAFNYTDFLYRPRRPEELDTTQGGGVVLSQGSHQIDIIRLLGGGRVRSVRGATGSWDKLRPTEGAYSAFLDFEDGVFATAVYSGFGHFDSDEFSGWISEMGFPKSPRDYGAARNAVVNARRDGTEIALKNARAYGGSGYESATDVRIRKHQHFGTIIVSCDHADLRILPDGVIVYGDYEIREDTVKVSNVARVEVIDELYDAVANNNAPLHSGAWAMATMEACFAIFQSQRERAEVILQHQISI